MSAIDITVVNILLKSYDDLIEAGGTAGGKRANKFAEYINEKNGVCDKTFGDLLLGTVIRIPLWT